MDDIVGRLTRVMPDTDKDRYDLAYARGRAQARSSLIAGGLAIGLAAGAALMFLLDPRLGRGRRIDLRQRIGGAMNGLRRTLAGTPPSNAERRALEATPTLRTAPRSSVAGRTQPEREPVPTGGADR